jgi:hypothetical protein
MTDAIKMLRDLAARPLEHYEHVEEGVCYTLDYAEQADMRINDLISLASAVFYSTIATALAHCDAHDKEEERILIDYLARSNQSFRESLPDLFKIIRERQSK